MDAGVEHVLGEGAARLHFYVRKYVREQYTKLGGIIQGITFCPDRRYANGSLVMFYILWTYALLSHLNLSLYDIVAFVYVQVVLIK